MEKPTSTVRRGVLGCAAWLLVSVVPAAAHVTPEPLPPLAFEVNHGQADPAVRFIARSRSTVLLTADEVIVQAPRAIADSDVPGRLSCPGSAPTRSLRMRLGGARPVEPVGVDELPGKVNLYRGRDPASWRTGIATYRQVAYREVYPGIDLIVYGRGDRVEFDLVVAPGADPDRIRLEFSDLPVSAAGRALAFPDLGMEVHVPVAYQESARERRAVEAGFRTGRDGVGFRLGGYDRARTLIIDPIIAAVHLGGSDQEWYPDVAVDPSGNRVVVGQTFSVDFPTVMAYQGTFGGGSLDGFVTKFSPSATMLYSTYLGGSDLDAVTSVAIAADGSAVLGGHSSSDDFPVANAWQPVRAGGLDGIVARLDPAGQLVLASYFGGSAGEGVNDVALGPGGEIALTGTTGSHDFPRVNAVQSSLGDPTGDPYVAVFDGDVTSLLYSTYFGGTQPDYGLALAVDAGGGIAVVGTTESADFPTVNAAFNTYIVGRDGFAFRLFPDGSPPVFSTFLPGSQYEYLYDVAVDAAGSVHAVGETLSPDFPVLNAWQPVKAGSVDACVVRFAPDGTLQYSTFLGGLHADSGHGIVMAPDGGVYVTGKTSLSGFPVTCGLGQGSAFLTKLDASGSLVFSGVVHESTGNELIALAPSGHPVVVGQYIDRHDWQIFMVGLQPARVTCPGNRILSCVDDTTPAMNGVPAHLGFCDPPVCTHVDDVQPVCGPARIIRRAWTCSDGVESASCEQVIEVRDRTPPSIFGMPPDAAAACDEVPPVVEPRVTDLCDPSPSLTLSETRSQEVCADTYRLTRTWTATDVCGNRSQRRQVIEVSDTSPPAVMAALEPVPPSSPRSPGSPRSVCSAPASRTFHVRCAALDECDPVPGLAAKLVITSHDVVGGSCSQRSEEVAVECDEPIEVRLLAPPCPARPPRSPAPAVAVGSGGVKVIHGEEVVLVVAATDRCGNQAEAGFDPATAPSPLCEERLGDGTCCPALAVPATPRCPVSACVAAPTAPSLTTRRRGAILPPDAPGRRAP